MTKYKYLKQRIFILLECRGKYSTVIIMNDFHYYYLWPSALPKQTVLEKSGTSWSSGVNVRPLIENRLHYHLTLYCMLMKDAILKSVLTDMK